MIKESFSKKKGERERENQIEGERPYLKEKERVAVRFRAFMFKKKATVYY